MHRCFQGGARSAATASSLAKHGLPSERPQASFQNDALNHRRVHRVRGEVGSGTNPTEPHDPTAPHLRPCLRPWARRIAPDRQTRIGPLRPMRLPRPMSPPQPRDSRARAPAEFGAPARPPPPWAMRARGHGPKARLGDDSERNRLNAPDMDNDFAHVRANHCASPRGRQRCCDGGEKTAIRK